MFIIRHSLLSEKGFLIIFYKIEKIYRFIVLKSIIKYDQKCIEIDLKIISDEGMQISSWDDYKKYLYLQKTIKYA